MSDMFIDRWAAAIVGCGLARGKKSARANLTALIVYQCAVNTRWYLWRRLSPIYCSLSLSLPGPLLDSTDENVYRLCVVLNLSIYTQVSYGSSHERFFQAGNSGHSFTLRPPLLLARWLPNCKMFVRILIQPTVRFDRLLIVTTVLLRLYLYLH